MQVSAAVIAFKECNTMQEDVETLLNEVKEHYDHPLEVDISRESSGVLTHDQSH